MDPAQALCDLITSLRANAFDSARLILEDLIKWRRKGGFIPDGPIRPPVDVKPDDLFFFKDVDVGEDDLAG